MSKNYIVAEGRCIAFPTTNITADTPFGYGRIMEGEIVSEGDDRLTAEAFASCVKKGSLLPLMSETKKKAPAEKSAASTVTGSAFNLDPDGLKGKKLEELNVMLAERGADAAKSAKDAVAALTKDYEAPKA